MIFVHKKSLYQRCFSVLLRAGYIFVFIIRMILTALCNITFQSTRVYDSLEKSMKTNSLPNLPKHFKFCPILFE